MKTSVAPRADLRGAFVRGVGTAAPAHRLPQSDAREFAEQIFAGAFLDLDRLLPVFQNTLIAERRIAEPLPWYGSAHSFPESNAAYVKSALELSVSAARSALTVADLRPEEIRRLVFVSTTGIATPSLDSLLIPELGCLPSTGRLPVWGLGCAGGVTGLARAHELCVAADGPVLLVAVELCSLTFQHGDRSKSNLVAVSLFGDGAAAVVLEPPRNARRSGRAFSAQGQNPLGPDSSHDDVAGEAPAPAGQLQILASFSHLFPDSQDVMGWDLTPGGLKVRFSRDIPSLVRDSMPALVEEACASWGVERSALRHVVLHPGGARVLAAYEESLGVSREDLASAYRVLGSYGNISSASVLFVLADYLSTEPPSGDLGLMAALGPGFSAELLLFRY